MFELKGPKKVENIIVDIGIGDVDIDQFQVWNLVIGQKVIGHDLGVELEVIWELIFVEQGLGDQGEHIVLVNDHDLAKAFFHHFDPIEFGLEFLEHQIGRGLGLETNLLKSDDFMVNTVRHTKRKSIQTNLNGQFSMSVICLGLLYINRPFYHRRAA